MIKYFNLLAPIILHFLNQFQREKVFFIQGHFWDCRLKFWRVDIMKNPTTHLNKNKSTQVWDIYNVWLANIVVTELETESWNII